MLFRSDLLGSDFLFVTHVQVNSRRQLRGEILGSLLLADINVVRDELVQLVAGFNGEKMDLIKQQKRQKEAHKGKAKQGPKGKKEPAQASKGGKRGAEEAVKGDGATQAISYKRSKIVFKKSVNK